MLPGKYLGNSFLIKFDLLLTSRLECQKFLFSRLTSLNQNLFQSKFNKKSRLRYQYEKSIMKPFLPYCPLNYHITGKRVSELLRLSLLRENNVSEGKHILRR